MDVSQEAMDFMKEHVSHEHRRVTVDNFDVVVELKNLGVVRLYQYDARSMVTTMDMARANRARVRDAAPAVKEGGRYVPIADDYAGIRAAAEALQRG